MSIPVSNRYNPCFDCLNRYGREYSKDCVNSCDYAYAIRLRDVNIEDLNTTIRRLEARLAESERLRSEAYQVLGQMIE